ncbi:PilX N-terminal domain-containing pilus assembly protein [Roseateles sp. DC23W]|uniref:PilX N-terminal domain-containing pilus assembly protein n=1 Tax=Pelomonas dachongensis TaxID=3299029 RepID=A0ABW7EIT5_9BURK
MNRVSLSTSDRQQGAATLVVVMMLFLIMALLAAYANRGLLFEQRMSNSYYRASMAQEASEAGTEWALAQLNGLATDASCKPVASGGKRFADRYLTINAEDRTLRQTSYTLLTAGCVKGEDGWQCRCQELGKRTVPVALPNSELTPSFDVNFSYIPVPNGAGTISMTALGCTTSVVDDCRGAETNTTRYQAKSLQSVMLALVSAVRSPPLVPLVVKGNLTSTGAGLGLHNTSPGSAGLLVTAGGNIDGLVESRLESVPGTPPALALIKKDPTLNEVGVDVFRMFMGATADRYENHPALRKLTCNGDCGTVLEDAYKAGVRMAWIDGGLTLSSNKIIGSDSDPMLVVADGDVQLSGPFQLSGMLVSRGNLSWTNNSGLTSLINGTVLVEGNAVTEGTMDILYLPGVANQLRNRLGSYVRVPGGWQDVN